VVGGVPLVLMGGPGAEARQALGWIVVGGLGFATIITLFITPVAFLLIAGFAKTRAAESERLESELGEVGIRALAPDGARGSYHVAAE
jgi:HAE1 family hydrophobic/amphiphilic exporter-1